MSSRELEVRCIVADHEEEGGDAWRWLYEETREEEELSGGRVFTFEREAFTGGRCS